MTGIGRGCVKTLETKFVHGIFRHVGSIALELLVSIPLLSNLRGMRNEFLHSLGRLLPLLRHELVAVVRRSSIVSRVVVYEGIFEVLTVSSEP